MTDASRSGTPTNRATDDPFSERHRDEQTLREELPYLFPDERDRDAWLNAWNVHLGGATPQQCIDNGHAYRVLDVVRSVLHVGIS